MAKEGKSKFKLNKGTDHKFDISKSGKRKFDLTKDVDEPTSSVNNASPVKPVAAETPETSVKPQTKIKPESVVKPTSQEPEVKSTESKPETQPSQSTERSGRKWLWIVAVIIIVLLAWWLWPSSKTSEAIGTEPVGEVTAPVGDATETPADDATAPDSQSTPDVQSEDAVPAEAETSSADPTVVPEPSASVPTTPNSATSSRPVVNISNDIETEAMKVIHGDYGVGQERKEKLGSQYQAIQKRVNELKQEGAF